MQKHLELKEWTFVSLYFTLLEKVEITQHWDLDLLFVTFTGLNNVSSVCWRSTFMTSENILDGRENPQRKWREEDPRGNGPTDQKEKEPNEEVKGPQIENNRNVLWYTFSTVKYKLL